MEGPPVSPLWDKRTAQGGEGAVTHFRVSDVPPAATREPPDTLFPSHDTCSVPWGGDSAVPTVSPRTPASRRRHCYKQQGRGFDSRWEHRTQLRAVGIPTDCGLDDREFGVRVPVWEIIFPYQYRPDRVGLWLLSSGTGGLSPAVKQQGCVADHSPQTTVEVNKTGICTSAPIRLHGMVLNCSTTGIAINCYFYLTRRVTLRPWPHSTSNVNECRGSSWKQRVAGA
jgi:hypothetical protein